MQKLPNIRNRLFCPGPTPVPQEAALASLQTDLYHRSPEFKQHFVETRSLLRPFFDANEDPLILTSSGTGALEAAMVNFTTEGDEILVINGGKFGERWEKLGHAYGCQVTTIQVEWGDAPEIDEIRSRLKAAPQTKAIFLQANETSTGVAYPIQDIARTVREVAPDCLIIVDAVSALVAHHVKLQSWDLDCVISGSQKGFGVPPGLAFLAASERAWNRLSGRSRFYFDLARERKGQKDGQTAWTTATSLVMGLKAALGQLNEVGVDGCVNHHRRMAEACRSAAESLGLELFSRRYHSQSLTAIRLPDRCDGTQLVKICRERYGAVFAGGQDQAKGKIIRIAHLGIFDQFDTLTALSAFEFGLSEMGFVKQLGQGVAAAMQKLGEA
jgi:aspartate aminotransferase-like enzyme